MNGEQPPAKKRNWVLIIVGVFALLFVLGVGGCVVAISLFRQSMTVTEMSASSAEAEFEKVKARFAGQAPLIEMVEGRPQYAANRQKREGDAPPLKTMHVIAWDDDDEQLVTFSLPMWLLRLKSGPIELSAYSQGWDDRGVKFTVEDLERYGPGLLMDFTENREGRVIVWVE